MASDDEMRSTPLRFSPSTVIYESLGSGELLFVPFCRICPAPAECNCQISFKLVKTLNLKQRLPRKALPLSRDMGEADRESFAAARGGGDGVTYGSHEEDDAEASAAPLLLPCDDQQRRCHFAAALCLSSSSDEEAPEGRVVKAERGREKKYAAAPTSFVARVAPCFLFNIAALMLIMGVVVGTNLRRSYARTEEEGLAYNRHRVRGSKSFFPLFFCVDDSLGETAKPKTCLFFIPLHAAHTRASSTRVFISCHTLASTQMRRVESTSIKTQRKRENERGEYPGARLSFTSRLSTQKTGYETMRWLTS